MKKKTEREYKVETIGKPSIEHLSKTEKQIFYSTLLNETIKWKQEKENKDNKKGSHE